MRQLDRHFYFTLICEGELTSCRSVDCGIVSQTQSAMQSATQSFGSAAKTDGDCSRNLNALRKKRIKCRIFWTFVPTTS
jgi:hypothetical protein